MLNWVSIARNIHQDVRIISIAYAMHGQVKPVTAIDAAVGKVVRVLSAMVDEAKDGSLSQIPDAAIEEWAQWQGKPGVFAKAFRTSMCDDAGVVRKWDEYNGAKIRNAEAGATRKKNWREKNRTEREAGRGRLARRDVDKSRGGAVDPDQDLNQDLKDKEKPPISPTDFVDCISAYPDRPDALRRRKAFEAWEAAILEGATAAQILAGVQRYAAFCNANGRTGGRYVMAAHNFFADKQFEHDWAIEHDDPEPVRFVADDLGQQVDSPEWIAWSKRIAPAGAR
jgi:hypothetical protein